MSPHKPELPCATSTEFSSVKVSLSVPGYNDVRIKEKPIKEKTFKETDKKKQVIYEDVKKGI